MVNTGYTKEPRASRVITLIDYVSFGPLTDDDPMNRVKYIVALIEGGTLKNEGAAFGGLLNLGDERVCRLLAPLRDSLSHDAVNEAVKCSTGFIYAATADFYLDWLEGMEASHRGSYFTRKGVGRGIAG